MLHSLTEALGVLAEELSEAKAFPIGTKRDWKGGRVQKTRHGWVRVPKEKYAKHPDGSSSEISDKDVGFELKTAPEIKVYFTDVQPSRRKHEFTDVDLAFLGKALQTPKSPTSQYHVRNQFRKLFADFGMVDRDVALNRPNRNKLSIQKALAGAGMHSETGRIYMRRSCIKGMQKLHNVDYDVSKLDDYNKHMSRYGLKVFVHEVMHGHGVIPGKEYKGGRAMFEEVLTELAARKVTREAFGDKLGYDQKVMDKIGSYKAEIGLVVEAARRVLAEYGIAPKTTQDLHDLIGEASIEMSRQQPLMEATAKDAMRRYTRCFPVTDEAFAKAGFEPKKIRAEFEEKLYRATKHAIRDYRDTIKAEEAEKEAKKAKKKKKATTESVELAECVYDLARNDLNAALDLMQRLYATGNLRDEDVDVAATLQDDPHPFYTELAIIVGVDDGTDSL